MFVTRLRRNLAGTALVVGLLGKDQEKSQTTRTMVSDVKSAPRHAKKMPRKPQSRDQGETLLRELAKKLLFRVEKAGDRFTLVRTSDVSRPVRHELLTMSQAEEVLRTWKLRGLGGG